MNYNATINGLSKSSFSTESMEMSRVWDSLKTIDLIKFNNRINGFRRYSDFVDRYDICRCSDCEKAVKLLKEVLPRVIARRRERKGV